LPCLADNEPDEAVLVDELIDLKNDILSLCEVPLVEHDTQMPVLVGDGLNSLCQGFDPRLVRTRVAEEKISAAQNAAEMSLGRHCEESFLTAE
jgi:hypothetical protein